MCKDSQAHTVTKKKSHKTLPSVAKFSDRVILAMCVLLWLPGNPVQYKTFLHLNFPLIHLNVCGARLPQVQTSRYAVFVLIILAVSSLLNPLGLRV